MNFISQYWRLLSLAAISIIFLASRFAVFGTHFTHYDDNFGPYWIQVITNYDVEYFSMQVIKYGAVLGEGMHNWITTTFLQNDFLFNLLKRIFGALSISLVSTFAPLQFIFTALILNFELPYEDFIKVMRLPSLIFAFASFGCLIYFSRLFEGAIKDILMVCATTLLTISWMVVIYTSQAENFSLGLFAILIMFVLIHKYANITPSFKQSLFLGAVLTILCFAQYQVMFYLPGFYLGYLLASKPQDYAKRFLSLVPAGIITLLSTGIIYFVFLSYRLGGNPGVHWNAGFNNEFVWNPEYFSNGIIEFLVNFIYFFVVNSIKVLYGIFGFRESFDSLSILYASMLFIVSIYGLYKLASLKNYRHIFVFIVVTIACWIGLILLQVLTYSPTRHSIALIPIVITLFSFGLDGIFDKLRMRAHAKGIFIILFCSLSLGGFISSFPKIYSERLNPFLYEVDVVALIEEYSVVKIASFGHTTDLNFHPEIYSAFDYHWSDQTPYTHVFEKADKQEIAKETKSIMIVCANSDICGSKNNELLAIKELDFNRANVIALNEPIYQYSSDSDVTNGFSNMAGSGTRRIFLKIYEY